MKVFVSHSNKDRWVARQISRLLEAEGHTTFLDEKDLESGDSIDESIRQHLKESDHLLLLLSPASVMSHWVFIELGGARILEKRIVPITLYLGINEIPREISQLLARDIDEFEKYLEEIRTPPSGARRASEPSVLRAPRKRTTPVSSGVPAGLPPKSPLSYKIGDRVRIVEVERLTDEDKAKLPVWVPQMDKYSGVETHIVGVRGEFVSLAADGRAYEWSTSWIAKID